MDNLPPDNVLRQSGLPDREERAEIAKRQKEASGFMTAKEIADEQRKALNLPLSMPG